MIPLFDSISHSCVCNRCGHTWKSRGEDKPKTCAKCTSKLWDDGSRKFDYIIARLYGREENGDRLKFCIIPYVDKPIVETDDIFYVNQEDANKYFKGRYGAGSAVVLIGSFEIGEDQLLQINEMKLIYVHSVGFREYLTDATCLYNIKSYYEAIKEAQRLREEAERKALLEEQRKQERLAAALRKLEEEEARAQEVAAAKRTLSDETADTETKLKAVAFLERVR